MPVRWVNGCLAVYGSVWVWGVWVSGVWMWKRVCMRCVGVGVECVGAGYMGVRCVDVGWGV